MKAQGTVRGILVEGSDGHEYLLGFRPTQPVPTPILSRRQADGRFAMFLLRFPAKRLAIAPPDARHAALRVACYWHAAGELNCVGVVTQAECNKQCAEALCDDWF